MLANSSVDAKRMDQSKQHFWSSFLLAIETEPREVRSGTSVRSAIKHIPQALMLQGSLMVDSTDFRTRGNENASSLLDCSQAAQKGRPARPQQVKTGDVPSGVR